MIVEEAEPRTRTGKSKGSHRLVEPLAVLDQTGTILSVNSAWLTGRSGGVEDLLSLEVGDNVVRFLEDAFGSGEKKQTRLVNSVRDILEGRSEDTSIPYPSVHAQNCGECSALKLTALNGFGGAVLAVARISAIQADSNGFASCCDILEGTSDAVFLLDLDGRLLLANSALADLLDSSVDALIGLHASELPDVNFGKTVLEHNETVLNTGKRTEFEVTLSTPRGYRTFWIVKGVQRDGDGNAQGVYGIARDISEVKAMEREIIDSSDKEKQRLGQELHENLCQHLVGISLLGNVLFEELSRLGLKQADDARQVTSLVKIAVTEVRTLVKGLTPLPLEQEAGLISALEDLAEQVRVIGKVKCTFKGPKSADFLEPSTSVHLYRIAQEAAHNAVKHAQAKRIQIKLTVARKELVLTVLDDGIGFAQQRTAVPCEYSERSSGLGLHIMNYRARAIGGRLEINKLPGKGTAVVCTLLPKELGKKRGRAVSKSTSAKSLSFSI